MAQMSILLMEDNTLLRWWLTVSLIQQGFKVTAPATNHEFVDALDKETFDALVTDCDLADCCDGFQVLSLTRQRNPRVLAILISAQTDQDLPARAQAAGFNSFMPKPVSAREIAETILGGKLQKSAEVAL